MNFAEQSHATATGHPGTFFTLTTAKPFPIRMLPLSKYRNGGGTSVDQQMIPVDQLSRRIGHLLDATAHDARQRPAVLVERCGVSDDENLRMAGYGKVVLNSHAASPIGWRSSRRQQVTARRRRSKSPFCCKCVRPRRSHHRRRSGLLHVPAGPPRPERLRLSGEAVDLLGERSSTRGMRRRTMRADAGSCGIPISMNCGPELQSRWPSQLRMPFRPTRTEGQQVPMAAGVLLGFGLFERLAVCRCGSPPRRRNVFKPGAYAANSLCLRNSCA